MNDKRFYSIEDLMDVMGITKTAAYQIIKRQGFPVIKAGSRYKIPVNLFWQWIEQAASEHSGMDVNYMPVDPLSDLRNKKSIAQ